MFSPVQIKNEFARVEEPSRINTSDDTKYPIFGNQDGDYKYHQLPQFWNQMQLPNEIPQKTEVQSQHPVPQVEEPGSLTGYVKDYLQQGILFQLNQHQEHLSNQIPPPEQCHQTMTQENSQMQPPQNMQYTKPINQAMAVTQSGASIKQNRPGRPPKGTSDPNTGRKFKCQCEICFKEFGHKSNLFIHMRTHNGERPYKCSQCEKCFTHSGNLAIHMRTHSGERPYGCQICGKMFSHSGNLSTHLRTHSGVKPYKCSVCAKEFRHSGNLSIHERIHSGIKPFQCKVCGKEFYHSGNLTTHMKKHTVNTSANANQCENNRKQSCTTENYGNASLNSMSNASMLSSMTSDKLIHNASNIPIKNESTDKPLADAGAMSTSRT